MAKYYVDANIWRDFKEDRTSGYIPIGEIAFQFFKNLIDSKDDIIVKSEHLVDELSKSPMFDEIAEFMLTLEAIGKLETVKVEKIHVVEAIRLAKAGIIHFKDGLHAVLAKHIGAIIVTQDKGFDKLDFIEVIRPNQY